MYDFRNIDEYAYPMDNSVQLIFDGVNIDKKVPGFRTIGVYGRELVGKSITMTDYTRQSIGGSKRAQSKGGVQITDPSVSRFRGAALEPKIITVEYALVAENNEEFRKQYELLNYLLINEEVPVLFTDDLDYYWIGTVGRVDQVSHATNKVMSKMDIECSNPYKRAVDVENWEIDTSGQLKKELFYPLMLEKLEVMVQAVNNKWILKNETNGQRIILDKKIDENEFFTLDFIKHEIRGKTNQNYMKYLDLRSEFEDFLISSDDVISSNIPAKMTLFFRRVML